MDILAKINWVDILVIILIVRTTYVSLQDGLSHEVLPLFGSICMLTLSLHYYKRIALFFYNNGLSVPMELLDLASFVLVAVCTGILFRFLKVVIDKIIKVSWNPVIDRFGGMIVGVVRGAVLASIVLTIIALIPLPYLQWSVRDRSLVGPYFLRVGPTMHDKANVLLPAVKK